MPPRFTDNLLLNGVMSPPFITTDLDFTDEAGTMNIPAGKSVRIWAEKACRVKAYAQDGSAEDDDDGMPLGDGESYEFITSADTTISAVRITESGFLSVTLKNT